jgi:hypothetical protein
MVTSPHGQMYFFIFGSAVLVTKLLDASGPAPSPNLTTVFADIVIPLRSYKIQSVVLFMKNVPVIGTLLPTAVLLLL